jgi:RimJ/RimL family protein N-acetyltransferase
MLLWPDPSSEKVGAVREGVLRDRLLLHNTPHDAVMFSIVRSQFETVDRDRDAHR